MSMGSPERVSASVAGRGADGGANPSDPTMDPLDFHAMMDREKAQQAAEAEPADPTFRERTWTAWQANPVERKNGQLAKKRAMQQWRQKQRRRRTE